MHFNIQKKFSQVHPYQNNRSPFTKNNNKSPLNRSPFRPNLSPMKRHQKQLNCNYGKRKQFGQELQYSNRTYVNFEQQLNELGNSILSNKSNNNVINKPNKLRQKLDNFNNFNTQPSDPIIMKDSKKLFSKCLAQMNTERKRNQSFSNKNSLMICSKQNQNKIQNSFTSFKALKIQMIESVRPDNTIDKQQDKNKINQIIFPGKMIQTKRINQQIKENKQYTLISLINNSFSQPPKIHHNQTIKIKLQAQPVYQSVQEQSDYGDFDILLAKAQLRKSKAIQLSDHSNSVRISIESNDGLTMDPVF